MNRTVPLVIGGALLALLVLWFGKGADVHSIGSDLGEPSVTSSAQPTEHLPETPVASQPSESLADSQAASQRMEPNIFSLMDGRAFPDVESSPWSDGMENTILSHVSQSSLLGLTDLQVQCDADGCVIFMGGPNVPLQKLNFGEFAQGHGFTYVVIRDRDGTEGKIVILRR